MREQDRDWVRSAVLQHQGQLTLYAARLCGDTERARDVVQETFLRLCGQERAALDSHLAEWLYSVCRHCALDVKRKESRMTSWNETAATAGALDARAVSLRPAPAELAERGEDSARIVKLLGDLPPNQQEVIRLKFQHGLSYKEIATVTKLSATNVGFLIHTGLKKIREQMVSTESF